jgi:hypothetical protein
MKKLSVVLAEYTTSRNAGSKEALLSIVALLSIAKLFFLGL